MMRRSFITALLGVAAAPARALRRQYPTVSDIEASQRVSPGDILPRGAWVDGRSWQVRYLGAVERGDGLYTITVRAEQI